MANSYTLASVGIKLPEDQKAYAKSLFEYLEEDYAGFDMVITKDGIIVCHNESIDLDAASAYIARVLDHADIDEPVILEYAMTCSKPMVGAFGGGMIAIDRTGVIYARGTGSLADEYIDKLKLMPDRKEPWTGNKEYPYCDWQAEAAAGNTLRGYWDWVLEQSR